MLDAFHFLRPLWLLALVPLAMLAWRTYWPRGGDNPWRRVVDARLLPLLMFDRRQTQASRGALWLIALGWTIAVTALADPTWERKPQPVFQTTASRVIVLDLASSMDTADMKPTRLARARYKIEDILAVGAEGQTGLVVYAGDAFTVSPLTRDANTIRALLKALDPSIMPAPGSRADRGLLKAGELLRQAGASNGQIVLISDGIDAQDVDASQRAAAQLARGGYRVSVIGVVADDVTVSATPHEDLSHASDTTPAAVPVDAAPLRALAASGGGIYQPVTASVDDLRALLDDRPSMLAVDPTQTDASTQRWKEQGPLLALLLIPLAALAFRRNWLLAVAVLIGVALPPQSAMAFAWDDLWQRPDQQAAKALHDGDYAKAAAVANDANSRGAAAYKLGDFKAAQDAFAKASGADADYNRGNALAKLGQYQNAVTAYDKALAQNPVDQDARANKATVEALLKQHPPQQQASDTAGDKSADDQAKSHDDKRSQSGNAQDQPSKGDGKSGQNEDASDKSPQAENAHPGDESKRDEQARTPDSDTASKGGRGDKAGDQRDASGAAKSTAQKPGNDFAAAANKLAEQKSAGDQADTRASSAAAPGNAARDAQPGMNTKPLGPASDATARPLKSEEQIAAEQWLRRIPDDPGGLLRRKFLYQYRQRGQRSNVDDDN